ncbi:MAG: hypothetical protein PVI40_08955 [Chlamydiota bacterium]
MALKIKIFSCAFCILLQSCNSITLPVASSDHPTNADIVTYEPTLEPLLEGCYEE